jgi:hypothetical protein
MTGEMNAEHIPMFLTALLLHWLSHLRPTNVGYGFVLEIELLGLCVESLMVAEHKLSCWRCSTGPCES